MPRLPIGPANIAPPLQCERLEDRSLLSATSLFSVLGDLAFAEMMPCEDVPADGIVLEEGLTAVPYDDSITTLEWVEGRDGSIDDAKFWDDSLVYETGYWDVSEASDEYAEDWYSEEDISYSDEVYDEDGWYYEDEYWDDSWYYEDGSYSEEDWYSEDEWYSEDGEYVESWDEAWSDELYWDETWDSGEAWDEEYVFVDGGGMTGEEYEDVWMSGDRSDIAVPAPEGALGDWSWTQGEWTNLENGMVYTMALAGGIAIPKDPAAPVMPNAPANDQAAETTSAPAPMPEDDVAVAVAVPPSGTESDVDAPPEVAMPRADANEEPPAIAPTEPTELHESSVPALAPPSVSDDHLTDGESLELSVDLRVG
jgi:hypothetical protein